MRIAFVGGFAFNPRGTIRARAHPLAVELARLGHEATIFLPPYDNLSDSGREWEQEGVRIRNVEAGRRWWNYPLLLARLIGTVNRYRPHLIHIFKPKGFAGTAATYWLLTGRRSLVLDCDDWEGWGGWNEVKPYPWVVKEFIDRQERWLMQRAPAVTVASRALETRAAEVRGESNGVYYLPNCGPSAEGQGIQAAVRTLPREAARRDLGLPDVPLILYSGHFEDKQSVSFFCHAARSAIDQDQAAIVFAGAENATEIRSLFSGQGKIELFFFSRLAYERFLRLIHACDVAAFPYRDDPVHRAKCSARIIDYMAMGKAVLTSDVGQNREYIVNGESGILVPPGNEEEFAAKLRLLLQHHELRNRLGENAALRIQQKFRWDGEALEQCLAAYDQTLATTSNLSGSRLHRWAS